MPSPRCRLLPIPEPPARTPGPTPRALVWAALQRAPWAHHALGLDSLFPGLPPVASPPTPATTLRTRAFLIQSPCSLRTKGMESREGWCGHSWGEGEGLAFRGVWVCMPPERLEVSPKCGGVEDASVGLMMVLSTPNRSCELQCIACNGDT